MHPSPVGRFDTTPPISPGRCYRLKRARRQSTLVPRLPCPAFAIRSGWVSLAGMRIDRTGKPLDRARLRKLLGMLGSDHDGEALNAARLVDELMQASGSSWETLIPDEASRDTAGSDKERLDQLLQSNKVSDVVKIRLKDMRRSLLLGRLTDGDRRLLRLLYRKAVVEGAIVTAEPRRRWRATDRGHRARTPPEQ